MDFVYISYILSLSAACTSICSSVHVYISLYHILIEAMGLTTPPGQEQAGYEHEPQQYYMQSCAVLNHYFIITCTESAVGVGRFGKQTQTEIKAGTSMSLWPSLPSSMLLQ